MKKLACLCVVLIQLWGNCLAQQPEISLEKAERLFNGLNLSGSRKVLLALLETDTLPAKTRAGALIYLARQNWKFFRNYDQAARRLDSAVTLKVLPHRSWLLRSRIEREKGNYSAGLMAAEKTLIYAQSEQEKINGQIAYAATVYDWSLFKLAQKTAPDSALLRKGAQQLENILQLIPVHAEAAKLLLGTAILRQNGKQALRAWLSYFHFVSADSANAHLHTPAQTLSKIMPRWKGNTLSAWETKQMCSALAASGFYTYAALAATTLSQKAIRSDSSLLAIVLYADYLKTVEKQTQEYYRAVALGQGEEKEFVQALEKNSIMLLEKLKLPQKGKFEFSDFLAVMEPRFGTAGYLGKTSAFGGQELALGHVVNRQTKVVHQYGYEGKLTFTQLDLMISNGYKTWFTEVAGNGGWSSGDNIVQIRSRYLDEPAEAWYMIRDSSTRSEKEALIKNTLMDPAVTDTAAILEGLSAKLRLDALDQLYSRLYEQGVRGNQLRAQFLTTFEKLLLNASIFAHEGRHSIDQIYFSAEFEKASLAEREYRAKLSEIVFSGFPKFILSMLVNKIGESGHGQANRKIIKTATEWLSTHSKQVAGYKSSQEPLKQIYRLTAEQIKSCYQSADPLFEGISSR